MKKIKVIFFVPWFLLSLLIHTVGSQQKQRTLNTTDLRISNNSIPKLRHICVCLSEHSLLGVFVPHYVGKVTDLLFWGFNSSPTSEQLQWSTSDVFTDLWKTRKTHFKQSSGRFKSGHSCWGVNPAWLQRVKSTNFWLRFHACGGTGGKLRVWAGNVA